MSWEIVEETKDFFEDLYENLTEREQGKRLDSERVLLRTKRAYQFTERVESIIKMLFGISVIISAIVATVWGFIGLSDLVEVLINSILGRIALFFVGVSYLINGLWRYLHSRTRSQP